MQNLISETYRDLNKQLHTDNQYYGTSGAKYSDKVRLIADIVKSQDILDYGCGKSTLANNLPFPIKQYDPAIEKYSALPEPADIVVCTDVLEHIEPECLDDVLQHILSLAKLSVFFVIATTPAQKVLADGRNAHLIVKPYNWWFNKIVNAGFGIVNLTVTESDCSFFCSGGANA